MHPFGHGSARGGGVLMVALSLMLLVRVMSLWL